MVKECMTILTNMTELQSKKLSTNMKLTQLEDAQNLLNNEKKQITPKECFLPDVDLNSADVVNIDGILLPIYDKENVQSTNMVPVKSTINNLRSLALAVASGMSTVYIFLGQYRMITNTSIVHD